MEDAEERGGGGEQQFTSNTPSTKTTVFPVLVKLNGERNEFAKCTHGKISKSYLAVRNSLSGNTRCGAINEALGAVDDVNNGNKLAVVGAVVNHGNPADFYEACENLSIYGIDVRC
jgi:hypothetical protein